MFNSPVTKGGPSANAPEVLGLSGSDRPDSIMRDVLVTAKRKRLPDIEKLGDHPHEGLFDGILPSGVLPSVTLETLQLRDFRQVKLGATLPGE